MGRLYSVAKLKAGLSSILADVENGGDAVITDHNRPIARLTSVRRVPRLPASDVRQILAFEPLALKRGAQGAAALVRHLRDDEDH